jgi:hypothetical protein
MINAAGIHTRFMRKTDLKKKKNFLIGYKLGHALWIINNIYK